MKNLLQLLQFTINVRKSHLNLSALCSSCAKIACCESGLFLTFLYVGSSIRYLRQQFVWCIHFSFVNFAFHPTQQKKKSKGVRSGDSNSYISVNMQN